MSLLWRDSGKTIRFLGVDGRAALGLLLVLLHISLLTFGIAMGLVIFFSILERFDYTLPNAYRKARCFIAGKKRFAHDRRVRKTMRSW